MKFLTLCTVVTTLAFSVEAMVSNTLGVRGEGSLSLLTMFHGHPPVSEHDVGPMLKSAESMLMGMASSHRGAPLADLVAQIRPFIKQMQDSINVAHSSAQQTLTTFGNDFAGCNSAKATGEAEVSSLQNITKNHSDNHKSCRTREKSANDTITSCQSTLTALEGAKNSSCQLYEDGKLSPGCGAIPPNQGENWESYVARAAAWFPTARDEFLRKKAVCHNDTQKSDAQRTVCLGADGSSGQKKAFEDVKQECDNKQSELESATCSYVSKVDATCESFATCTNTLADNYDAQKASIKTLENQRKVEWNATERLLCLLDVYGSSGDVDATKLQTCQHTAENTSHLNLVYPAPTPRPSPCADLLPHPCGADYETQEYAGLDSPAAKCTACSFAGNQSAATRSAATGITDKTEFGLQTQQGSLLTPTWIMKKCHEPQPDTHWKPPALWTDSPSLPATSDEIIHTCDVVSLWIVSASKLQDCAWGTCSQQTYPPPSGHWGSPYKPQKEGRPCGEAISSGDAIYFDRMWHDAWPGDKFLVVVGNDLAGGDVKTIFTIKV